MGRKTNPIKSHTILGELRKKDTGKSYHNFSLSNITYLQEFKQSE